MSPVWDLILAINTVRNRSAHSLESEKRRDAIDRMKSLYFSGIGEELAKEDSAHPDHEVVAFAIGFAHGFLGGFYRELKKIRGWIDRVAKIAALEASQLDARKQEDEDETAILLKNTGPRRGPP